MTKGGLVIPNENEFTVQPDDETVTSREPGDDFFDQKKVFSVAILSTKICCENVKKIDNNNYFFVNMVMILGFIVSQCYNRFFTILKKSLNCE